MTAKLPDLTAPIPALVHALTPPQVAKVLGWTRRRTFRYLKSANARMSGRLLHNTNEGGDRPRWVVAVEALKLLMPEVFADFGRMQKEFGFMRDHAIEAHETVDEMKARIRTLEAQVGMLIEKVGGFR